MPLLEPDAGKIGRPDGAPHDDRVSDAIAEGAAPELREALAKLIGEQQVHHRAIDLIRYASDASACGRSCRRSQTGFTIFWGTGPLIS